MTFAGKVALITGGTTGIGEAAVRLVTSLGAFAGLLYGASEEAESKVHCRLLWPDQPGGDPDGDAARVFGSDAALERVATAHPLGRIGGSGEVAGEEEVVAVED